jgi:HEAT repeat protein
MPEVTPLSPELSRSVSALARSLIAAARSWALYPPEHPAVRASLDRLRAALKEAAGGVTFSFAVTPDTLLIDGVAAETRAGGPIAEAAAWLHQRDIAQLTFAGDVALDSLQAFLAILADDVAAVRARGGPASAWAETGRGGIAVEQIDFTKILTDADAPQARRKDDLWHAIVRAVSERRKTLDEAVQRRLLEIAGDAGAIAELATDVMAPNCTPDGSPMLTSQAAAVVAAYRHLVNIVDVMEPHRRNEVIQNLATATSSLDPRVVMHVLSGRDEAPGLGAGGGVAIKGSLAAAFDDMKVAQLLATTLAIDGQASDRLAEVFDTIAPDEPRKRRVLTLARSLLSESAFGHVAQFQTLWTSMEELLLSYNERPFVSESYRTGLDQVGSRATGMATDIPPELASLVDTLGQENVRRLSVILLIDLLKLERDPKRAPEVAADVATLCEDLLMAGDYEAALSVTTALAEEAANPASVVSSGSRVALDGLVQTAAFRESVDLFGGMDEAEAALFATLCQRVGPASTDALLPLLDVEERTAGRQRATAVIRAIGAAAAKRLAPLVAGKHWYAQRNAAELLGELGSTDGVPLLQSLLRGTDARVLQEAVRALSSIDDPAAARSVHTVLRAAAGEQRKAVVAALVAERDPRVVPVLVRILEESDAMGADHQIVLETLGAIGTVGRDEGIPPVATAIRRTGWFGRKKLRAIKEAGLDALKRIGSQAAKQAIGDAAANGDRLLRKMAKQIA